MLSWTLAGCLHTTGDEIQYPLKAQDDKSYYPEYQKVSQQFDVVHHFETKMKAQVTMVTPEFQKALVQRYDHIWKEQDQLITEAEKELTFFVSLYTANRELENLADEKIWSVLLTQAEQTIKPKTVKRLRTKERWEPFFPEINSWTQEFLVVFPLAPTASGSSLSFAINSPDGQIMARFSGP